MRRWVGAALGPAFAVACSSFASDPTGGAATDAGVVETGAPDPGPGTPACGPKLAFTELTTLDGAVTSLTTADGVWASTTTKIVHIPAGSPPVVVATGSATGGLVTAGSNVGWRDGDQIFYVDGTTTATATGTLAQKYVDGNAAPVANGFNVFFAGSATNTLALTQFTPDTGKGTSPVFTNDVKRPLAIATAGGVVVALAPIATLPPSIVAGTGSVGSVAHVVYEQGALVADVATDGVTVWWLEGSSVLATPVTTVKATAPTPIATVPGARRIRFDGAKLWVTTSSGIVRMPLDGSCQETATLADAPSALAVGTTEVFVAVGRSILHSPQ